MTPVWTFASLAYLITWVLLAPWFYAYTVVYAGHVNRTPNFPPVRTLIFPPSVGVVVPSFISTS